jgi:hypothetical protein
VAPELFSASRLARWDNETVEIEKMLRDLRAERDQLNQVIITLERLAVGHEKRRGRPPAWMVQAKRRGRPPGSKNKPKG